MAFLFFVFLLAWRRLLARGSVLVQRGLQAAPSPPCPQLLPAPVPCPCPSFKKAQGSIPADVKGGLLELFYGVYEKDSDRCLEALIAMGVLVPGGDRTAVRRTADFFLKSFQERLVAQKTERGADAAYAESFKQQPTKEEKKAKRKAILSSIGEDLLVASADKPFRFPVRPFFLSFLAAWGDAVARHAA